MASHVMVGLRLLIVRGDANRHLGLDRPSIFENLALGFEQLRSSGQRESTDFGHLPRQILPTVFDFKHGLIGAIVKYPVFLENVCQMHLTIDPKCQTTTAERIINVVGIVTFAVIFVVGCSFGGSLIPLLNNRVVDSFEPTIDAAIFLRVPERGTVDTECDLVVFEGKIVFAFWDETTGCEPSIGIEIVGQPD